MTNRKAPMIAAAAAAAAAGSQLMVANEVAMGERQACERLCVLPTQGCNPLGDVRGVAALVHLFYRFSKAPANEKRPSDNNGLVRGSAGPPVLIHQLHAGSGHWSPYAFPLVIN